MKNIDQLFEALKTEKLTFVEKQFKDMTCITPMLNEDPIIFIFRDETQIFWIRPKDPIEAAEIECTPRKYAANLCFAQSESKLFPLLRELETQIQNTYPEIKPLIKDDKVYLHFKKNLLNINDEKNDKYSLIKGITDDNIHKVIKKNSVISGVTYLIISKGDKGTYPKLKIEAIAVKPSQLFDLNIISQDL